MNETPAADDDNERAAPLAREDVEAIVGAMRQRREFRRTLSLKALARRYGVSIKTLQRIESRYGGGQGDQFLDLPATAD